MRQIYLFLLLFITFNVNAQRFPDIEKLLENNDIEYTESGYEEIVQTLAFLYQHPLHINTAPFDSLKMLFFLSDSQIDQIMNFRQKNGAFRNIHELLLVPGMGERDLNNIRPFVYVGNTDFLADERKPLSFRHELLSRLRMNLPKSEGYHRYKPYEFDTENQYQVKSRNRFHGVPLGTLFKYRLEGKERFSLGVTLENDPGEGYFTTNQPWGFDFVSAYAAVKGRGFLNRILVGDYKVQWGQGLTLWSGFSSGKSDLAVGNEKAARGIIPNTSTDENKYLRGLALSMNLCQNTSLDVFFSYKKTDATVTWKDTLDEADRVRVSLYESGYHRNDNECDKKHQLKELATGLSCQWNTSSFRLGVQALYYDFRPGLLSGDKIYERYYNTGEDRWTVSADYKTAWRKLYMFGEMALSNGGALAALQGIRITGHVVSGSLLYRHYGKRYSSYYSGGFGEYGNTSNEEGLYCGLNCDISRRVKLNVYVDWFHCFSSRYRVTDPGHGCEFLSSMQVLGGHGEHLFRYKMEVKPEDLKGGISSTRVRQDARYQYNFHVNASLEVRTRFNMSLYKKAEVKEQGYWIGEDLLYTHSDGRFKMQYRAAWFHTDSYNSRIYAYENNVLYAYSFPSFTGKGWRTYLNLSWKPFTGFTCYFKTGLTVYSGRDFISSGVNRTDGNKRYDLALQVRWMF